MTNTTMINSEVKTFRWISTIKNVIVDYVITDVNRLGFKLSANCISGFNAGNTWKLDFDLGKKECLLINSKGNTIKATATTLNKFIPNATDDRSANQDDLNAVDEFIKLVDYVDETSPNGVGMLRFAMDNISTMNNEKSYSFGKVLFRLLGEFNSMERIYRDSQSNSTNEEVQMEHNALLQIIRNIPELITANTNDTINNEAELLNMTKSAYKRTKELANSPKSTRSEYNIMVQLLKNHSKRTKETMSNRFNLIDQMNKIYKQLTVRHKMDPLTTDEDFLNSNHFYPFEFDERTNIVCLITKFKLDIQRTIEYIYFDGRLDDYMFSAKIRTFYDYQKLLLDFSTLTSDDTFVVTKKDKLLINRIVKRLDTFPKDLTMATANLVKEIEAFKNATSKQYSSSSQKAHDEAALNRYVRATGAFANLEQPAMNDKDYFVIIPKDFREIAVEGMILSHCVTSYINPVMNGDSAILFLRKKESPEEPFITIELDPETKLVREVAGKYSNSIDDHENASEIHQFVNEWMRNNKLSKY